MKKIKFILVILAMVTMLIACGSQEDNDAVKEEVTEDTSEKLEEPLKLFGTFTSQTLEGEEVTDEIFAKADLTMVNIWGTYCGPCIVEMPDLGELARENADKGFQIVGIVCDINEPGDETALEIAEKTKADYTHMVASDDLVMNTLQYVSSVPTTVFIDKEGNMVGQVHVGARSKEEWESVINQYLEAVK